MDTYSMQPFTAAVPTQTPDLPLPNLPVLTPQNIVQPLPDITLTVLGQEVPCGTWSELNGWIADHPEIATVIVLALAFLAWPRKRK